MRFHGLNKESPEISDSLLAVTRDVLTMYTFDDKSKGKGNRDSDLADIAGICLNGKEGLAAATQVAQKLADAIMTQWVYEFDYPKLLDSLAKAQPVLFLDVFLGGSNDVEEGQRRRMFFYQLKRHGNPLNQISDDELLSWCGIDSAVRYQIVASAIAPFMQSSETGKLKWKPVIYAILDRAVNLDAILEHLANSIRPTSWSGSLADILVTRTALFQELYEHDNAKIRAWAKAQYLDLQESIRGEREREQQRHRERNETFE